MKVVRTAESSIEYVDKGAGSPVTLFAHGLGGSIQETRPLSSGVDGTKIFIHQRGHGGSISWSTEPWTYPALSRDLEAVADEVGASRFVGVSMGVGACLSLLTRRPDRFERCVFFLPGGLSAPRSEQMVEGAVARADMIDSGDVEGLKALLLQEVPDNRRDLPEAIAYAGRRAQLLAGTSVSRLFRALPTLVPVPEVAVLREVTASCLVIGQQDDPLHPAAIARELADALGPEGCACHVFPENGAMWNHRDELRSLIAGHLNPST